MILMPLQENITYVLQKHEFWEGGGGTYEKMRKLLYN